MSVDHWFSNNPVLFHMSPFDKESIYVHCYYYTPLLVRLEFDNSDKIVNNKFLSKINKKSNFIKIIFMNYIQNQ